MSTRASFVLRRSETIGVADAQMKRSGPSRHIPVVDPKSEPGWILSPATCFWPWPGGKKSVGWARP
jgi:hypothetical protein